MSLFSAFLITLKEVRFWAKHRVVVVTVTPADLGRAIAPADARRGACRVRMGVWGKFDNPSQPTSAQALVELDRDWFTLVELPRAAFLDGFYRAVRECISCAGPVTILNRSSRMLRGSKRNQQYHPITVTDHTIGYAEPIG